MIIEGDRRESALGTTKAPVLQALRRYGYQSQSYNVLLNDKSYFFSTRGVDGVIAYVVKAKTALTAGDPVCDPDDIPAFVDEFREFCRGKRWKCCLQAITERCEDAIGPLGFGSIKIGEEPIFDLRRLSWAGSKFRDLRKDIRSAKKLGLSVVEYRPLDTRRPDLDQQMEQLSQDWMKLKGSGEFSFLIGEPNLSDPGERKYFLALSGDEVEAFIVCTPIYARHGIYFDLMRRKEESVKGTAQLLITEAFRLLSEQGYDMATLGTAPLANEHVDDPDQSRLIELILEFGFNYLGYFHRNKPLYQFKEQFGPTSWEARYLAYWPPRLTPTVLYALLKAYDPSGVSGKLRRQAVSLWDYIKGLRELPRDLARRLVDR
ncbi:MAG: DUF2156 domain-containing protein [Chloroflexi bacterium]|nr:DUF2156 domain-containing protein [Chloroflexota bacterium]